MFCRTCIDLVYVHQFCVEARECVVQSHMDIYCALACRHGVEVNSEVMRDTKAYPSWDFRVEN